MRMSPEEIEVRCKVVVELTTAMLNMSPRGMHVWEEACRREMRTAAQEIVQLYVRRSADPEWKALQRLLAEAPFGRCKGGSTPAERAADASVLLRECVERARRYRKEIALIWPSDAATAAAVDRMTRRIAADYAPRLRSVAVPPRR